MATKVVYSNSGRPSDGFRLSDVVRSTSFTTKEGVYINNCDQIYSRPNRGAYYSTISIPVHISVGLDEYILFNVASEAFVYNLADPGERVSARDAVDKWSGKNGQVPLCHDVNDIATTANLLPIVLGFKSGLIAYYNPLKRRNLALLNANPVYDGSSVLDLKWQPGEKNIFASAHRSGYLYFWTVDNSNNSTSLTTGMPPLTGSIDLQDAKVKGFNKTNLLQKWEIGRGAINAFAFSPDGLYIAVASQDGFMRVYNVRKREFHGRMRSYFGGFLCICWSPDGKYVVTGGEDDLVTVWSFEGRCVVTRCEGHHSWVNAVAFDPIVFAQRLKPVSQVLSSSSSTKKVLLRPKSIVDDLDVVATPPYPLVSVGEDGRMLLWDLTADALRIHHQLSRGRSGHHSRTALDLLDTAGQPSTSADEKDVDSTSSQPSSLNPPVPESNSRSHPQAPEDEKECNSISREEKLLREVPGNPNFQLRSTQKSCSTSDAVAGGITGESRGSSTAESESRRSKSTSADKEGKVKTKKDSGNVKFQKMVKRVTKKVKGQVSRVSSAQLETYQSDDVAPSMDEVNLLDPVVTVEVSPERLTDVAFVKDAILVACHNGFVQVWQRPEVAKLTQQLEKKRSSEKH